MKLARIQQALALGGLALAAGWLMYWWRLDRPGIGVIGVAVILFGHSAVLALEFQLMARINRSDPAPRVSMRQLFTAWLGECLHAPLVFCWRQPFRAQAIPDSLEGSAGRRGVLLVHGFVCNRGLWNTWLLRLRQREVPFVAVNLEPVFGSIDDYVPLIEAAVLSLEQATGRPPLVVAHSMGGLAVRRWLSGTQVERVQHVITLGTPHCGTWLARWAVTRNSCQMRRASRWIEALQDAASEPLTQRFTCFYSHCDNIVFPASTATLPGADNRHLPATAHVQMADHPAPWAEALRHLA